MRPPPRSSSSRSRGSRRRGRSITSSPRASRWSIARGPVGSPSPSRSRSATNASGSRAGRRLRSPPNTSGSLAAHSVRARPPSPPPGSPRPTGPRSRAGSPRIRGLREAPPAPTACAGARGRRQAHSAGLDDASRMANENLVGAALAGGEQVGVEIGQPPLQRRQQVARRERQRGARASAPGQRPEPARWRFLEERHVPVPAIEEEGELGQERPVDLCVRGAALGQPQEPRAPCEQRRIRGEVATVVEVPAEDSH